MDFSSLFGFFFLTFHLPTTSLKRSYSKIALINVGSVTVISNGFKGGGPGAALDKSSVKGFAKSAISKFKSQQSYAIDDPDKTDSIFILSSDSQKIDMTLSKGNKKIGKKVLPLSRYVKPQGILSADRIILNSKKDEILLVANTDVKIVTKGWNSDMEEFFERITGNGTTVMKFKRDWCAFGDELIVDTPIQE